MRNVKNNPMEKTVDDKNLRTKHSKLMNYENKQKKNLLFLCL